MILAFDPGFGNSKICTRGGDGGPLTAVIQTAAAKPKALGLAGTGLKTADLHEIAFDGFRFAVGPGAWYWGETLGSMDYGSLAAPERRALFYAALSQALPAGEYDVDLLVVGLPVALLQDQAQAEAACESLRAYKGAHEFCPGGKMAYRLNVQQIKVLAQPVGAYADWLIGDDLKARKGGKDAEVAVLDLGMNTLDLYVLQGGMVAPRFVGGAKVGVRRLLTTLNGHGQDVAELDAALRAGRLKAKQPDLAAWLGEVMSWVERAWPSPARFSAVVPTGGGSLVLGDLLRAELARRGAAVAWPKDPITANVVGMWKWYARGARA